jgi:UDP-N-acetylmuramoyl-L-alanyl-D-glutamate--2,6-diaminopimelate ligase
MRDVVRALEEAGLLLVPSDGLPEEISGIADDSRAVTAGSLFVAVRGSASDGHDFLESAEQRGAVAAIVERPDATPLPTLLVSDGRRAAALAAAVVYGHPAAQLTLVGVTGTNGKTTTVGMLRHVLDREDKRAASIGTLGILLGSAGETVPGGAGLTTPGPVELQRVLRTLVDAGVRTVAMEVSSHSLDQRRVDGLEFDAAVFTNLTRDHLDYHHTMEAYFAAKAKLAEHLTRDGAIVANADDPAWAALPRARRLVTFSSSGAEADVRVTDLTVDATGSSGLIVIGPDSAPLRVPLLGDFNVANAAAAAGAAHALGMPIDDIVHRIATIPQVPGRLELINERPAILRDYSHTPDSLERALAAMRPFTRGRLIVVFGAGGDRDPGKRPEMGRVAEAGADIVIVTSDNPRTEDPNRILDDIERGMSRGRHERIEDRRQAIARAIAIAAPDDVVVLAGKGHETYQIRGVEKLPFDERAIVAELIEARA